MGKLTLETVNRNQQMLFHAAQMLKTTPGDLESRIDQQILVTEIVSKCVDLNEVREIYPKLAEYMCRNISIMMAISSIHLLLIDSREAYSKRRQLWKGIKEENSRLYFRLKYTTLSGLTYLPGKVGGMLTKSGYRAARKIYQFQ